MNQMNARAAVMCWILIAAMFGFAAYGIADGLSHPVKSTAELCVERGGVYVDLRSGARCFSREAFK